MTKPVLLKHLPRDPIARVVRALEGRSISCHDRDASPGPMPRAKYNSNDADNEPSKAASTKAKLIDSDDQEQLKVLLQRGWHRV